MQDQDKTPTRNVRRTVYLANGIYEAFDGLQMLLGTIPKEQADRVLGFLHFALSNAWDHGASRETDLRAAVDMEHQLRLKVEAELHELKRGEK